MFTAESDSERILKIGQHLPKLWAIKYRVVFYETRYSRPIWLDLIITFIHHEGSMKQPQKNDMNQ